MGAVGSRDQILKSNAKVGNKTANINGKNWTV